MIGSLGFSIAHASVSMYSSGEIPIAAHNLSLVSRFTAACGPVSPRYFQKPKEDADWLLSIPTYRVLD